MPMWCLPPAKQLCMMPATERRAGPHSFAADRERINKVLAAGRQAEGDCYTWERGGKW